ncbi:MAG: hypothetical protein K9N47_19705, partial [Prosthecobacter sp.]|uniref:hypothetical protein n=1 Tax=Prosthecobacter sp. TaxID=1965333 RepID=UPI0025D0715E
MSQDGNAHRQQPPPVKWLTDAIHKQDGRLNDPDDIHQNNDFDDGDGEAAAAKKQPDMNGTQLSAGAIAITVRDFMELMAFTGEQLIAFRATFRGSWLSSSGS